MHKQNLSGKNIFILLTILAVLFIGVKVYSSYAKSSTYDTVQAKKTSIAQVVYASGEIKSEDEVELKFPVSGKLTNLAVKKNDQVKKWGYVASLDKKELQKTLDKSLRDYSKTRWDLEEANKVTYQNVILTDTIKRVLDKNQFDLDKAVMDVEIADFAQKNAGLYSPIDGVVTKIHTQAGTSIIAGSTPIVTIADPENIFFIAKVGESDIVGVSPDQDVLIKLDAFPDKKFSGKVVEVDYAATVTNGNKAYYVKIALAEKNKVKLDMSGDVEITLVSHEGALVIPKSAIEEKDGKKFVSVLENKQVKQKEISIGIKGRGGMIEILSGVNEGDNLILPAKKK